MTEPDLFNADFAKSIVRQKADGRLLDNEACERELIRTPGGIQPHGGLLCIDSSSATLTAVSANAGDFLGRSAAELLGLPAADVLPAKLLEEIAREHANGSLSAVNPARFARRLSLAKPAECWVHARAGNIILELEQAGESDQDAERFQRIGERALAKLRDLMNVNEINGTLLAALREITGFERVLIYQFDSEWNGVTVAEDMAEGSHAPFLGLRFPASDIPRQARALYSENLLRLMADRDAAPVPVLRVPSARQLPLDLSGARLRAQSPIHLEYQRNINVNGAMSVSILKRDRLWGLVVGHHQNPHRISGDAANAVVTLVNGYAMRLHDLEEQQIRLHRRDQQRVYAALLEQMAGRDDVVDALLGGPVGMPALFGATGAAIVRGDTVKDAGQVPPHDLLRALKEHVQASTETGVVATDHSASWYPAMAGHAGIASGVLALPLRDDQRTTLFWFRPGVTETVAWAGDPRKSIAEDQAPILPRRSFERWTEQRSGYSEPWALGDIETATSLGFAIDEMILRHGRKIKSLNARLMKAERTTAEQDLAEVALRAALEEKDAQLARKDFLLREVDHRVRNSLALISSMLQLQARSTHDPRVSEQFLEASRRVITVGHVHQRLYQTGELQSLDFGDYLRALTADLSASASPDGAQRLILETTAVTLSADIVIPLGLIVNELVTNAFKHGGKNDRPVAVNVSFAQDAETMRLIVEDDGGGLPEGFDPRSSKGLGMRLVNGLIVQLNARLEYGRSEKGARFTVIIPAKSNGSRLPAG